MKSPTTRRLAAVMFTDIVGYTAMMQADEQAAVRVRWRHREVFRQQHERHGGEIIQYYGDGTLSVFGSAVEAVKCAIDIQSLLQQAEPVPLRIGLHMGDIVYNQTDVYGDGVNYASRIQSMGIAGAILLSGKLNDELKNQADISSKSLGLFKLKNIAGDVEVFAITNAGIAVPQASELAASPKAAHKTIAVLPFVNRSASAENEYFSDGMTEEIINALSRIKNLKVTSRISSFFFKNKNVPLKQIGSELNVSAILEGSVRLSGNKVRITAQLVDAEHDVHFWSETWDRELEHIFEIQDEISLAIAHKLREHVGHFDIQDHLVGKQTQSVDAYEYSLKAKFHFNRWNPEDMRIAISLFEKAIELDAQHTESYLGLAECYGFMATTGFMPFEEAWGKSTHLTYQAEALNDQLPRVRYQLARLAFFAAGNYREAFSHTAATLALEPNSIEGQQFMSFLHIIAGDEERALDHLQMARDLDPLSHETLFYSAYFHYMVGDYETALYELDKCLAHNSKNNPVHAVKCHCLLMLGRYDEVIHYFEGLPPEVVMAADSVGFTGLAYALKKDDANTAKHLTQLLEEAKGPRGFNAESYLFLMYAVTGKNDEAFNWIGRAIAAKSPMLLLRFGDPLVDGIKGDPRYVEMQRMIFAKELLTAVG